MILPRPIWLRVSPEVAAALDAARPVVALESAVYSHGLPAVEARRLAVHLDEIVRRAGAIPALIAVCEGRVEIGGDPRDMDFLLVPGTLKLAERDLAVAVARRQSGGATVAATLAVANAAGIRVMATGGIGGVHIGAEKTGDVSADLDALSRHPLVVVCAGAKAICDSRRTVEALDSLGVAVVGYQTSTFPAFLAPSTGIPVPHRVENAGEIAAIARAKVMMGGSSALLVVQPPPRDAALDERDMAIAVTAALEKAGDDDVGGAELTPYLLNAMAEATGGRSLTANLAVLGANAALAAEVAVACAAAAAR